jgi:UDP-N-acetylmuramoyl-L-alanyl-D-glutamate--2,6-diaminopimelate ligase
VTSGRLIVLFGAGGDRDRTKRPEMGAIAERMADAVVLTSDNPRHEDGDAILDDIERGMRGSGHRRVVDREKAILETLAQLADGDCLVLAGKGHETYQIIGDERTPFDERAIVRGYFGLPQ